MILPVDWVDPILFLAFLHQVQPQLDITQDLQELDLVLDFVHCLDSRRSCHAEVVRNSGVEFARELLDGMAVETGALFQQFGDV